VNDPEWRVRCAVAEHGHGLDLLIQDPEFYVQRTALIELLKTEVGYLKLTLLGLKEDLFKGHPEIFAKSRRGLDLFLDHPDWLIRIKAVEHDFSPESFIKDKSWQVRKAVAEKGVGLEVLSQDKSKQVREMASWKKNLIDSCLK